MNRITVTGIPSMIDEVRVTESIIDKIFEIDPTLQISILMRESGDFEVKAMPKSKAWMARRLSVSPEQGLIDLFFYLNRSLGETK